jgi:hydroxyacyl-ACP dehydratase HTD2-like protein with hotdog domain
MAEQQVYFEDVVVGTTLPSLSKTPSNTLLFLYSAVTWNPQRIHYDREYTLTEGYRDVIVHGPLRGAFLSQLLTRWIGDGGSLKKLSYANRDIAYVNEPLVCKGTVTRTWIEHRAGYVECDVWMESQQAKPVTQGKATVVLPFKSPESGVSRPAIN